VCNQSTATQASCGASTCTYTCNPGRANCDTTPPNEDGCECNTPGCCGSSCETIHSTGLGGSYYDCAAQATYNSTQALEACTAFAGNSLACTAPSCGLTSTICSAGSSTACACWSYAGPSAGHVVNGGKPGALYCMCPSPTDPTWN
jgi:hypothetical protein